MACGAHWRAGRRIRPSSAVATLTVVAALLCTQTRGLDAAQVEWEGPAGSGLAWDTARDHERAAVASTLRHIYFVYLAIRACAELSTRMNDGSFRPEVTFDEARRTLRSIDAATAEVGIDSNALWNAAAPVATVTAESFKIEPARHIAHCRLVGALFRTDAANLQANLQALGAKTFLITKDY